MATLAEQSAYRAVIAPAPSPAIVSYHSAYGVPITLHADADLLPHIPSPLIPGARNEVSEIAGSTHFKLYRTNSSCEITRLNVDQNGVTLLSTHDVKLAAQALESRIHQHVAAATDQVVFIHAGVVCWNHQAILIPGPSHSGKSTLVAALIEAGMAYYSDEYAVIDFEGRVHAFPRKLRLRLDVLVNAVAEPAIDLGLSQGLDPLLVSWVFNVRHIPGGTWKASALAPGQTLLAVLANSVAVRRQSEVTVRTLTRAVSSAMGFHGERGDAVIAAQEIYRLMETRK